MSDRVGESRTPAPGSVAQPTIRNIAVTDLSAVLGAVIWLALTAAGELDAIERALALAPFVLVPLALRTAVTGAFQGPARRFTTAAIWLQPVGAFLLVASLIFPSLSPLAAGLAVPWLAVTGLLGLAALARIRTRETLVLPETAIDAGFAYVSVGAVALLLAHLDLTFWFDPVIIRLTAVHFHYAGFVLPVAAGLTGRYLDAHSRGFRAVVGVILVGPALIAVGIAFSPVVEVVAVSLFTVAVAPFGVVVLRRVVPTCSRLQGALLGIAAVALPVSMTLALGYGISTFTGRSLGLTISTMVTLHGSLNAFGFGLCATLGWRLAVP
ncbi:YndJ family protein [Haloarcula sp. S1AR25-5A]|uniref:YndJ family protein n=1 Tax=Haloarcula terrestris TaxID=2950533 RepID=A0AAE4EVF1_9EURY|nr:YndJ family protein [Haloarcula terrestris]MDS0220214.1 YndJ family protein [Haloarcula terrestris]